MTVANVGILRDRKPIRKAEENEVIAKNLQGNWISLESGEICQIIFEMSIVRKIENIAAPRNRRLILSALLLLKICVIAAAIKRKEINN